MNVIDVILKKCVKAQTEMVKKIKIDIARKPCTFIECEERHEIFAPSWELLMSYKNGDINWNEYVDCYTEEMRDAFRFNPDAFFEMAERIDDVDFICWCNNKKKKDNKCHRFILYDILKKIK